MDYTDFQILNNDQYQLINEHYNQSTKQDRKTLLFQLCKELNNSLNLCCNIQNKFNFKIRKSIEDTNCCLNKLLTNLQTTFNISLGQNLTFKTFNLFEFLKKLMLTISLFIRWLNEEEKEYYKSLCQKSVFELIEKYTNILSALEESNLHFFKHM